MPKSKAPRRNARSHALRPEAAAKIRDQIKTHHIVKVLTAHVVEGSELSATQVTAGLGLLKKTLPDLRENNDTVTHTFEDIMAGLDALDSASRGLPSEQLPKPNGKANGHAKA